MSIKSTFKSLLRENQLDKTELLKRLEQIKGYSDRCPTLKILSSTDYKEIKELINNWNFG